MSSISKSFALMLTVIITISCVTLLTVKTANAQSVPTPVVPKFTAKFVNDSYGVTTINPYTGQSEINETVDDFIELTIQNQHLDYSNSSYQIYFDVKVKAHFSQDNWFDLYPLRNLTSSFNYNGDYATYAEYLSSDSPNQTSSSDTTFIFPVVPTNVYQASGYDIQACRNGAYGAFLTAIPYGSQLDFVVEAIVGHNSTCWTFDGNIEDPFLGYYAPAIAYDTSSGWSNVQTITIGQTSSSSNPAPTPTYSVPELSWLVVVPLLLSVFFVAVILRHRKTANLNQ